MREAHEAVRDARDGAGGADRESVEEFESQLAWREFYAHVLWDRPDVVTANFKDYEHEIEWRDAPEGLQAWKDGETGYPIVDAGMRQLRREAYMHNRVRMSVASFLTKDLMLDALSSLRGWYRERGSDLLVRRGDPRDVVPAVAESHGADGVTWAKAVSGLGRQRDAAVRRALDDADVAREAVTDALLHEPGSIRTNAGEVYSVFTYFWRKWRDREKSPPAEPPSESDLADVGDDEPLPTLSDLGFDEPEADVPPASMDEARGLLAAF
ncbi:hypothetical protein BRD17_05760, partial [Halobacteriales archaeon SW_7_68_16]